MTSGMTPALVLIVGAFLVPLLRGRVRAAFMLALPLIGLYLTIGLEHGTFGQVDLFGHTLVTLRVDKLSLLFGYIFHLAAFLAVIYALHMKDTVQQVTGLAYAGGAIGAVFAGDLVTLFVFWELTAITSVFLIWARRTERSYRAGMRYLVIQVGSGVILLAGLVIHQHATGSLEFGHIGIGTLGGNLIFLAFGIKCAFPLLHSWLQDAYPEATVTGTVFLSAFTTKLAVYSLARGYAGTEMLIWIGATMAVFPIFFALIENDLRRILAFGLIDQLGFMVVGIGIGSEAALNGVAAHAVCHILYKALLFMSMGAVLLRAGTVKGSELGGLYKSMPWTAGFCIIGGASISAFPLFSGFVSKSMILSAAAANGDWITWSVLLIASAGVFLYSGIKVPYVAFFGRDSGIRVREAPWNMLLAMGATAFLCIGIGVYPAALYGLLPFPVDYEPYTVSHVITQLQLLAFSALAFVALMRTGLFPAQLPSINLDVDWVYRRALPAILRSLVGALGSIRRHVTMVLVRLFDRLMVVVFHYHGPQGVLARTWPIGGGAIWVLVLLAGFLILYFS